MVVSLNENSSFKQREVLHSDALGSTVVVRSANDSQSGALDIKLQSMAFYDAFGHQTLLPVPTSSPLPQLNAAMQRGYTGHEMLNDLDIIHMNGRIFDPILARFVQADPTLQFPEYTQGYNRYAYVLNNPLTYTDPSGYFLSGLKKHWRTALSIGLSIWAPWGTGLWASIGTGAAAGFITTGSLKGALVGGLTAGMFHGVGTYFSGLKDASGALSAAARAGKVLAHGIVGGVSSVLGGGKFGDGFLSAGVTQALSFKIDEIGGRIGDVTSGSYFDTMNRFKRIVAAAVVGGTTSALTGGKFANGAITGAFSRAFNDEAHWKQEMDSAWNDIWANAPMLPQGLVDFSAGFGDTLSFGFTALARSAMGTSGAVNMDSSLYDIGEYAGVAGSLAFGGAHLGRNALNQRTKTLELDVGIKRLFSDGRSWGSVRDVWSLNAGNGKRWLKANGVSLHHWGIPQRNGVVNAGWNYMPISSGFNSWMNGSTVLRSSVEYGFRGSVISIYGATPTFIFSN